MVLLCITAVAFSDTESDGNWQLVLEDDFARPQMGANWRMLRGDWRIEAEQLRVTRQWPSDSAALCTIPMRMANQRAVFDVILGEGDHLRAALRSGEIVWGGGGIDERFGVRLTGSTELPSADGGVINVTPGRPHRVEISIVNGRGLVTVDGRTVRDEQALESLRSDVNVHFAVMAIPNGAIDNVRLWVQPDKQTSMPSASAQQNRRATVVLDELAESASPGASIQKAIDSLPVTGGAVVLPAGRFVLRRHIVLRSGVTLRGQGVDRTVLAVAPITGAKITERDGVNVTVDDASALAVGDAVSLGPMWAHPGQVGVRKAGNLGVLITAIDGNRLTLTEPPSEKVKVLYHFFPAVFARTEEFVEVRDLAIEGDRQTDAKVNGRFMVNPITFGVVYGARIHDIAINGWKGDGISIQGGADCLVTDNTITGVAQGLHPGTTTARMLIARNTARGNDQGLYFCWYNRNGVYPHNRLDSISGYADAGDVFNVLAFNEIDRPLTITTGYNGVMYRNHLPSLAMREGKLKRGKHAYQQPGRYFLFARNICDQLTLGSGTRGNLLADNRRSDGGEVAVELAESDSAVRTTVQTETSEVSSPTTVFPFPAPVVDGRKYYKPGADDCGFQAALDALAHTGGTLRLPAGVYELATPLRIPSRVTLAGQGISTVLRPVSSDATHSLIVSENTGDIGVHNLTLMGVGLPANNTPSALSLRSVKRSTVLQIDVRRWPGTGIYGTSCEGLKLRDCRVFYSGGAGMHFEGGSRLTVVTCNAQRSGDGFVLRRVKSALLEGNIASRHRHAGFVIDGRGVTMRASNASFNLGPGVILENASDSFVTGNVLMSNGRRGLEGRTAGILVTGDSQGVGIHYNNCGDEQLKPTQLPAIQVNKGAARCRTSANIAASLFPRSVDSPMIQVAGPDNAVSDNVTQTVQPTGSSLEWLADQSQQAQP